MPNSTWDRANRLTAYNGTSYAYDGMGNRVAQDALTYILDTQVGLTQVIGDSVGNRYIHSPRGIHAMNDGTTWRYMLQDGLGSVRAEVDASASVSASQSYDPYGGVMSGSMTSPFAFTGEMRDASGLQYHRARYYAPEMGTWINQDFLETPNRYNYANGNVTNLIDPSGLVACALPVIGPVSCAVVALLYGAGILATAGVWYATGGPEALANLLTGRIPSNGIGQDIPNSTPTAQPQLAPTAIPATPPAVPAPIPGVTVAPVAPVAPATSIPTAVPTATATATSTPDNGCLSQCQTQSNASGYEEFANKEDLLCNLRCHNGVIPANMYDPVLYSKGVSLELLSGQVPTVQSPLPIPSPNTQGVYLYPGQSFPADIVGIMASGLPIDMLQLSTNNSISTGGIIGVRNTLNSQRNRAMVMATLVEEITHATIYFGGFGDCSKITQFRNEFIAKSVKLAWSLVSGIDQNAFHSQRVLDLKHLAELSNDGGNRLAFSSNCSERSMLHNISYTNPQVQNVGCIDSIVLKHLSI